MSVLDLESGSHDRWPVHSITKHILRTQGCCESCDKSPTKEQFEIEIQKERDLFCDKAITKSSLNN